MSARGPGESLRAMLAQLCELRLERLSHLLAMPGLDARLHGRSGLLARLLSNSSIDGLRQGRPRAAAGPRRRPAWQPPSAGLSPTLRKRFAQLSGARTIIWRREHPVMAACAVLLLVLVVLPLLALAVAGVRDTSGLTFAHLGAALSHRALGNSLVLGFWAALLSLVVGAALAWAVARADPPGKAFIHAAALVALLSPPFATAIAYVALFRPDTGMINLLLRDIGLPSLAFNVLSMTGLVLVTALHTFAFVYFLTLNALENLDSSYEEQARMLGAGRVRIAAWVTGPLIAPALLCGTALALVNAVALFGPQAVIGLAAGIPTLPTRIYVMSGQSAYGPAAALSLVLALITLAALALGHALPVRRARTRRASPAHAEKIEHAVSLQLRWALAGLGMLVFFLAVVLPGAALIAASLGVPSGGGPTFANYDAALFGNAMARRALLNSVFLAIVAAATTLAFGAAIAWIDRRTHIPERRLLMGAAIVPLGVPGIVLAVALSQFWGGIAPAMAGTFLILLLAYSARYVPLAVGAAGAALGRVDASFERSARLLGAPFLTIVRGVSLPLMGPGLVAGGVLIFAAVMQDLGLSILLVGPDTITLPVAVYRLYEAGQSGAAAALAVVDLLIVGLAIWCAAHFARNPVIVPGVIGRGRTSESGHWGAAA